MNFENALIKRDVHRTDGGDYIIEEAWDTSHPECPFVVWNLDGAPPPNPYMVWKRLSAQSYRQYFGNSP